MAGFESDLKALAKNDAHIARALKLAGAPQSRNRKPGFPSLLRIIVNQQVSVHAGRAIWERLEKGLGRVTPKAVREKPDKGLRAFGLSGAKVRYAKGLAGAVLDGGLDLKGLAKMSDDQARQSLMEVKGIGRWTADIYLMFALGRPDVWPVGDLALAVAAERLLGLKARPGDEELEAIGQAWRPWRTTAAVMLWHFYNHQGPLKED
jgi:DNA-3-methyladenine glycosylase II